MMVLVMKNFTQIPNLIEFCVLVLLAVIILVCSGKEENCR